MAFHDGIFSDVESIPDSVAGGAVPLPAHLCDTQPEPAPLPPPANPQGKGTCCSKQAGLGVFWGVTVYPKYSIYVVNHKEYTGISFENGRHPLQHKLRRLSPVCITALSAVYCSSYPQ